MRADALLNQDRLLQAAADAFAAEGPDASLKAIAAAAGVGIGTLYRRFPTRERLVEATYRNSSAQLAAAATDLLVTLPPPQALREWMDLFVVYMRTKHGMADALRAVLVSDGDLRMQTRDLLTEALVALLDAGIAEGSLRDDVAPDDVLLALGGITIIAGDSDQEEQAGRMLRLLSDGLARKSG